MCVLRCDFMLDWPSDSPKLVEYNTIASSFGVLSQKVKAMQRYVKERYGGSDIQYRHEWADKGDDAVHAFARDKMSNFLQSMCGYFNEVIERYKASVKAKFPDDASVGVKPWVLFVVEDSERNVLDQKVIETELQAQYGICSMRCTFNEVAQMATLDADTHILKVRGKEIGFVYYRSGYQVEQYTCDADW